MDIQLHAFSGVTGLHIKRLTFSSLSWSDSLNDEGSLTATIKDSADAAMICRPYATILAAVCGDRVFHAGYITHAVKQQNNNGLWDISCGGGLTILDKRLVLNYALNSSWKSGFVVVDEENPKGNWLFSTRGTYSDLVSLLISETLKWGELPLVPATIEGGSSHERNYNSYDCATVLDRINDICDLEDGPEVRLDPVVNDDSIRFYQKTATEIIDHRWKWNAVVPGSGIMLVDSDSDGSDLCTQSYAIGGRDDDKLLVTRSVSNALVNQGYPVLQVANTQHSSVSILSTLTSYANADVANGKTSHRTYGLSVDISKYDVHVGDWADVRTKDGVLSLKVTDVQGNAKSSVLSVQCKERL